MSIVMAGAAILAVVVLCATVMLFAVWIGLLVYQTMRRALYARALTPEEQWAETSVEAQSVADTWSSVVASSTPPESR